MHVLTKFASVLVPGLMALTGCGVAPKAADAAASAGVERCGSETRACWQVKSTVEAEETPFEAVAATTVRHDAGETVQGVH